MKQQYRTPVLETLVLDGQVQHGAALISGLPPRASHVHAAREPAMACRRRAAEPRGDLPSHSRCSPIVPGRGLADSTTW